MINESNRLSAKKLEHRMALIKRIGRGRVKLFSGHDRATVLKHSGQL